MPSIATARKLQTVLLICTVIALSIGCDRSESAQSRKSDAVPSESNALPTQSGANPSREEISEFAAFSEQYASVLKVVMERIDPAARCSSEVLSTDVKRTESAIHPQVFESVIRLTLQVERNGKSITLAKVIDRTQFVKKSRIWERVKAYKTVLVDPIRTVGLPSDAVVGVETEQEAKDQTLVRIAQGIASKRPED